jgi:mRNA interferase RelE/StbE
VTWTVELNAHAERDLAKLPDSLLKRITEKLALLKSDAFLRQGRKLKGHTGYRLRIGDYRVLYEVDQKARKVIIYAIGHRKEVYR